MPAVINHYKTLGLPNYAPAGEVRKAYLKKIRLYHPDLNKSPEAEAISKQLNVAKEALETTDKKASYDRRLKWYLQAPTQSATYTRPAAAQPRKSRQMTRQERSRRNMARNKIRNAKEYEKWLKKYPMPLRYTLFSVLGGSVLLILYSTFLRGAIAEWVIMSLLVMAIYFNIVTWATKDYFNYNTYMVKKHNAKVDVDKVTSSFFNYAFYGGCAVVFILKLISKYL